MDLVNFGNYKNCVYGITMQGIRNAEAKEKAEKLAKDEELKKKREQTLSDYKAYVKQDIRQQNEDF